MGLFNFFKGSKVPPPLYHHGEPGSGNAYLSTMPSEQDPSIHQGNDPKTIKRRVKERVEAEIWLERRQAQMEKRERSEKRWRERMSQDGEYMNLFELDDKSMPPELRGPFEGRDTSRYKSPAGRSFSHGDQGFVGMADDPRALGFMPMGRRGERRDHTTPDEMRGMAGGNPFNPAFLAAPEGGSGQRGAGRERGGRAQGDGRVPRWPAPGDKGSAWNMHD